MRYIIVLEFAESLGNCPSYVWLSIHPGDKISSGDGRAIVWTVAKSFRKEILSVFLISKANIIS